MVMGVGDRRLLGRLLPPDDPRLLQGAAVHGGRLGDRGDGEPPEHRPDGRLPQGDAVHLRPAADRGRGAGGVPGHLGLLLEGRDPRLRRAPRRLLLGLRDRRLHRRAADRVLRLPDRLPGHLRRAVPEARELEQGHPPSRRAAEPRDRRARGHRRRLPGRLAPHRRARVADEDRDERARLRRPVRRRWSRSPASTRWSSTSSRAPSRTRASTASSPSTPPSGAGSASAASSRCSGSGSPRLVPAQPSRRAAAGAPAGLHDFLEHKWYFDEAIDILVVRPSLAVGRWANSTFERYVVQGLVDGATGVAKGANAAVRAAQSGYLRSYALLLVLGFAGLALYFLVASHEGGMIQVILWLPLAAGLVACLAPRRYAPWVAAAGSLGTLGLAVSLLFDFDPASRPPAHRRRGLDPRPRRPLPARGRRDQPLPGALTAVAWFATTAWDAIRTPERPKTWFLMLGLAETADARRLPRPGPDPVRPLLRPDADPVLLPVRGLGSEHPGREGEGRSPRPRRRSR